MHLTPASYDCYPSDVLCKGKLNHVYTRHIECLVVELVDSAVLVICYFNQYLHCLYNQHLQQELLQVGFCHCLHFGRRLTTTTQLYLDIYALKLRILISFNTDAIADGRLLIVVTQHDLCYTAFNAELELDAKNLSLYVEKMFIQRRLDISNLVIPVSGRWALLAKDLHKSPGNTSIVRKACEEYEMLPEEIKSKVRSGDIAERLEVASNIRKLQTRFEYQIYIYFKGTMVIELPLVSKPNCSKTI